MSTFDLKTQLALLIKLQVLDTEIYTLNNEKESKPQEIKALEVSFEEKKQVFAALEKNSLDLQKQKKDRELELGTKEESIKKLQGQLFQLKTNKEYNTMMQQIEGTKADISVIEDKILQIFEQIDKVKGDVEIQKQKIKEEERILNEEKKKIEERIAVIADRISQLDGQRKQIIPGIDSKIFAQYERILLNRDGLAIVSIKDSSCQGCNMFMPPQVTNLIKMYEHIITCETCNRMLYIDDEAV